MRFFNRRKNPLEEEATRVVQQMSVLEPGTEEYDAKAESLKALAESKVVYPQKLKLSPDAAFTGIVSLASVLLILKHEDLNVITSKAMNFVLKGKLK